MDENVAFDRECFFSELHEIMANKATFVDFRGGGRSTPWIRPRFGQTCVCLVVT